MHVKHLMHFDLHQWLWEGGSSNYFFLQDCKQAEHTFYSVFFFCKIHEMCVRHLRRLFIFNQWKHRFKNHFLVLILSGQHLCIVTPCMMVECNSIEQKLGLCSDSRTSLTIMQANSTTNHVESVLINFFDGLRLTRPPWTTDFEFHSHF